jgi:hypothetical protein
VTWGCHRRIETASVVFDSVWKDCGAAGYLRALFGNTNLASMFVWYSYPFTRSEGEVCLSRAENGRTPARARLGILPPWSFSQRGHVRVFLTWSSLSLSLLKVTTLLCLGRFQSITRSLLSASRHVYVSHPEQEQACAFNDPSSQRRQIDPSSKICVPVKEPSPTASRATISQDSSSRKVSHNEPTRGSTSILLTR